MSARHTLAALGATAAGWAVLISACSAPPITSLPLPERQAPPASGAWYRYTDNPYYSRVEALADTQESAGDASAGAKLRTLATTPVAEWFNSASIEDTATQVTTTLATTPADEIPLLVAYNIPDRDLGLWSQGGAADADAYTAWIAAVSESIGDRPAVVVVEPDALAQVPEIADSGLDAGKAKERLDLLATAIDTLHANTQTAVYLDVGNASWLSADQVADLLRRIDDRTTHDVTGISVNVSNYFDEDASVAYAVAVQTALGRRLFTLVDNSRNGGTVASDAWCNPEGQRLGVIDGTFDPSAAVQDAFVKTPGESDGPCGLSSLPAGTFDPDLLLYQLGARR